MLLRARVGVAAGFIAGAALAMQIRVNGALAIALDDTITAALASFSTGLVVTFVVVLALPRARAEAAALPRRVKEGKVRWWDYSGGVSGVLFIFSQTATGALIGAAIFTVSLVAGQNLNALLVDRLGIGPAGAIGFSVTRALAAVISLVAVLLAVWGGEITTQPWLALLPFVAGLALAWQQVLNARVAKATQGPFPVTLLNFAIGTVAFGLAVAWKSTTGFSIAPISTWPTDAWLYSGGIFGVAVVAISAVAIAWAGVFTFGLATTAGQLIASFGLDLVYPVNTTAISQGVAASVVLSLFAVVLVANKRAPQ